MDTKKAWEQARWWTALLKERAKAEWYLRSAKEVGSWPTIGGRPIVDATNLVVGDSFKIWSSYRQTLVTGWGPIRIGDRVFVNSGTVLFSVAGLTIGDDVAIANEVYITDTNSHGLEGQPVVEAPITIGDGTWIGARAMVMPGVTIGKRVVVAAGSVVTNDVPDETLVAGNPARVIRSLHYPAGCRRAWHDQVWCPCPKLAAAEGQPVPVPCRPQADEPAVATDAESA